MTDETGAGTLKLVAAAPPADRLIAAIEQLLGQHAGHAGVRRVGATVIVFCEAAPSEVRDWLRPLLGEGESAIVVEFARWSSAGPAIDAEWLLRRGH